jgi:hypothetical protein
MDTIAFAFKDIQTNKKIIMVPQFLREKIIEHKKLLRSYAGEKNGDMI